MTVQQQSRLSRLYQQLYQQAERHDGWYVMGYTWEIEL
jgi:hypothetical protein